MLIDGVKFACEPCIRGHRQATCTHTDRPLREIARRGRPVTACAHCRELRKTNNAHRTCHHEKAEPPEALLKTLPHGVSDLQSVSLVRRPSSTRSRSSVSSAAPSSAPGPSGATSTASASDQDLAIVGRKKSLSRPASISRRSSSARDKKPHDLAHGHLADHPTHVSAVYSPYPQHGAKEHHHSHHHLPPGPSPLSKGAERSVSDGPKKVTPDIKPVIPPVPSASTLNLPSSSVLVPTPPRSNSAPIPHTALGSASSSSSPVPALGDLTSPRPSAPLTTEQLASAYFFRDLPPQNETLHVPFVTTPAATTPAEPAMQAYFEAPALHQPAAHSGSERHSSSYNGGGPLRAEPAMYLARGENGRLSASPSPSLPDIDPAAANFVLGPPAGRTVVALAPMYGAAEGDTVFQDLEHPAAVVTAPPSFNAIQDGPLYAFAPAPASSAVGGAAATSSIDAWVSQDYPAPSSSAASSDVHEFQGGRRPSSALYGYPLEPVASHTLSSYSSASASGAPSLSATSALERLDLDFDLDLDRRANATGYLSSASHSAQTTPPHAPFGEAVGPGGQAQQATDLEGILEWLASASAGPPPLQPTDRSASGSGLHSTWPSAPPSVYGGTSGQEESGEGGGGGGGRGADGDGDQDESPPAPGPSGASRVAFGRLPLMRNDSDAYSSRPGSALAPFASGEEAEEEDDELRRGGDNDLEMLRTVTITCCDPSTSASHSSDEGGWAEGGLGGGRGDGAGVEEPFSLADLDLERFGVDEAWLRSLGLFGGPPEGEGDEDDGYEEDDEASVTGPPHPGGSSTSRRDRDADDDEEYRGGWTEDDFAWPPARPDPPPDTDRELAVKAEPLSGDEFDAFVAGSTALKHEEGERDRDEQGFSRGELWWS